MKMMLLEAKKWGYLTVNPALELERPRDKDHEIEILTPEELSLLVANTEEHYQAAGSGRVNCGVYSGLISNPLLSSCLFGVRSGTVSFKHLRQKVRSKQLISRMSWCTS
jgi:hypothetical protein